MINFKRFWPAIFLFNGWFLQAQQLQVSSVWPQTDNTAKPWTRWWWQGSNVTTAGITHELEALKAAGIGGVEITPIYGIIGQESEFIDFLSNDWISKLVFTLKEAKRLGLGVDMATGTGWPFGGPWVGDEDASKYVAHKVFHLKEGQKLEEPIILIQQPMLRAITNVALQQPKWELEEVKYPFSLNSDPQAMAMEQVRFEKPMPLVTLMAYGPADQVLDITEKVGKNGILNWSPPKGDWTLYAVFQGWHGKMVERAAPGGEGYVIDHFDEGAIKNYLKVFDDAFKGSDISGLRAFFNDSYEVDDARGQSDWTPDFFDAFFKYRHYDLKQHLPALFGADEAEKCIRVQSDFRETLSDLLLHTFTEEWVRWAKAQNKIVRNQAHGSPANVLDLYAACDIPETEGTNPLFIKLATSAGHLAGKKLIASEAATWLDDHFLSDLAALKQNVDRYFAGGVNHILYHGTCYSDVKDPWPGRLFYAAIHANSRNPLWADFPAFNQYVQRTQAFFQQATSDNDVLLYFPMYDVYSQQDVGPIEHINEKLLEKLSVSTLGEEMLKKGYAFDYVSDRQLLDFKWENGLLKNGFGTYKALIIPECHFISLATLQKLQSLAEAGAKIFFHGNLPASVAGWYNLEANDKTYQAFRASLNFQKEGNNSEVAKIGAGAFWTGKDVEQMLGTSNVKKEQFPEKGLDFCRYRNQKGNFYFLSNWSNQPFVGWVSIPSATTETGIFDPMTGKSGKAQTRKSANGEVEVFLSLFHGQSVLVQLYDAGKSNLPSWSYIGETEKNLALNGTWTINFIEGGPVLPIQIQTDTLMSWTEFGADYMEAFSGRAKYKLSFKRPKGKGAGWWLDLGRVHHTAKVSINGNLLGTLIGPTYKIFIDKKLLKKENVLEVEVSNLMANRIADLDKKGVRWKMFYNVNFPAKLAENRDENNLFSAKHWTPKPSGISGPVILIEAPR